MATAQEKLDRFKGKFKKALDSHTTYAQAKNYFATQPAVLKNDTIAEFQEKIEEIDTLLASWQTIREEYVAQKEELEVL